MNNLEKTVVILGASALQVPLINYVKKRGYRVIVVSIFGDYPGFKIADRCIYEDIRNGDAILKNLVEEEVVSVLTDETDISVPTVAYLTQKLNLPGNDMETAVTYSNKFRMRSVCADIGVPIPRFRHISSTEEVKEVCVDLSFPIIMKPEDNQGSRGVFIAHSENDIIKNFSVCMSFSKTSKIIVEEFFKGQEVVVEGFVVDGEYLNWGIADRKYFKIEDLFIPSQTIFPSRLPQEIQNNIIASEKLLHKKLNPHFGMIHSEYIVDVNTGNYILVETALRGGGVYISSHLVPLYTGYSNYDLLFDCSLGIKPNLLSVYIAITKKSSAYICFYLPIGKIVQIEGVEELKTINGVFKADISNIHIGMQTHEMVNKTMRLGPIIVCGEKRETVESIIGKIKETLRITVEKEDGSYGGVIWE